MWHILGNPLAQRLANALLDTLAAELLHAAEQFADRNPDALAALVRRQATKPSGLSSSSRLQAWLDGQTSPKSKP